MAPGNFKYLLRRAASDKVLHDGSFNFAKNLKCDRYLGDLAQTFFKKLKNEKYNHLF